MNCKNCGNPLVGNETFCPNCGASLENNSNNPTNNVVNNNGNVNNVNTINNVNPMPTTNGMNHFNPNVNMANNQNPSIDPNNIANINPGPNSNYYSEKNAKKDLKKIINIVVIVLLVMAVLSIVIIFLKNLNSNVNNNDLNNNNNSNNNIVDDNDEEDDNNQNNDNNIDNNQSGNNPVTVSSNWKDYEIVVNNQKITLPTTYAILKSSTGFNLKDDVEDEVLKNNYYALVNMYKNDKLALYTEVLNDTGKEIKYKDGKVTRISQSKYQKENGADTFYFPGNLYAGMSITEEELINKFGSVTDKKVYSGDNYESIDYKFCEDPDWKTENYYNITVVNGVIDELTLDKRNS